MRTHRAWLTCQRTFALSPGADAAALLHALALAVLAAFKDRDARLCRGAPAGLLCIGERRGVRVTSGYQRRAGI